MARKKQPIEKKKINKKIFIGIITAILILFIVIFVRAGITVKNISTQGGFFKNLAHILPGGDKLDADPDGRINIALIGIRGENVPGGGLLADTIMVASVRPGDDTQKPQASLVSVPRDLYVAIDGDANGKAKINAAHFYGEEKGVGGGLDAMKEVLQTVTGQTIHYAVSVNFEGFEKVIDDVGGIDITLTEPFIEPLQFHQTHVCDDETFTIPSGETEKKIDDRGKVVAQYPLCYNESEECGGIFSLPAGTQRLDGENALCYARSRMTSSDFERARRQQEVLEALQQKILSTETTLSISRLTKLLDTLETNVRMDLNFGEMEEFLQLYRTLSTVDINKRVLDTSQEGLLYEPGSTNGEGYILLPAGDTYEHIHKLFDGVI